MSTPSPMPRDRTARGLSLRVKTALGMALALLVAVSIYLGVVSVVMLRSFEDLQADLMTQRIDRVLLRLSETEDTQERDVRRRAASDRLFAVAQSAAQEVLASSEFDVAPDVGPDTVFIVNRQRNLAEGHFFNRFTRGNEVLPEWVASLPIRGSGLLNDSKPESRYVLHDGRFWLLSASPITRADGSGPSPGWLVYGQHLDEQWLEKVHKATNVTVQPVVAHGIRNPVALGEETNLPGCRVVVPLKHPQGDRLAAIEFSDAGAIGEVALMLSIPAAVYETAVVMRNELIGFSVVLAVAIIAASLLLIDFVFIRKIERMEADLKRLTQTDDLTGKLAVEGNDEFAHLALSVNRLLAEMRHRRSESEMQRTLLAGVLDSASEGIIAYRAIRGDDGQIDDFLIVSANASSARILGRTVESMIGRALLELSPGLREAGVFDAFRQTVEARRPFEKDLFYDADGVCGWFHIAGMPWGDGLVLTFEEISERKRAEEEIQRTLHEIERFNRAMIGREERILEMKTEVNQLRSRLGLAPAYRVDLQSDDT